MSALGGPPSRSLLIAGAAVVGVVAAGLAAGSAADEDRSARGSSAPFAAARTQAVRRRVVFGRSADGRALSVLAVGDPAAPRRVLVVGCIHGDETAGVPLVTALARGPAPSGFRLLLVGYAFRGSERVSRVLVVCRETCVRGGCKSGCRAAELCGA